MLNLFFLIQATMLFAELTYTLATEEAERIGVDHVARMTASGTGENSTGARNRHQLSSYHANITVTCCNFNNEK